MKLLQAWWPSIFWMFIIFFLSSRESVQVSEAQVINFIVFKTLHVIEYGVLFLLNVRAIRLSFPKDRVKKILVVATALTIAYALTDEIHQFYVPTREGRLRDVIIDGIGVILAWIFLTKLLPKAPKKLRAWVKSWLKN
jgi:VanZ family protein